MIASRVFGPAFQCRSGEKSVMPAHSSGAAASSGSDSGMLHDEVLVDDDRLAVAALRHRAVLVVGVVGERRTVLAVLLEPGATAAAVAAGVHHAAHADVVADLVLGDVGADGGDDAGDFVAGHDRVVGNAPLGFDGVDVGVADAGELDVDGDVVRAGLAAVDRGFGQVPRFIGGGVRGNGAHQQSSSVRVVSYRIPLNALQISIDKLCILLGAVDLTPPASGVDARLPRWPGLRSERVGQIEFERLQHALEQSAAGGPVLEYRAEPRVGVVEGVGDVDIV